MVVALVVSACSPDSVSDIPGFAWRDSTVSARPTGCDGPLDRCGGVQLTFPVFSAVEPTHDSIARILTQRIVDVFAGEMGGPDLQRSTDLTAASARFIAEYEDFIADFPQREMAWTMQGTAVVTAMDSVACVEVSTSSFMGGAHPLSYTTYLLTDTRTGKPLTIADLTADTTKLKKRAEEAFRRHVGIKPGASLTDGTEYWFENDQYVLPSNIGVTADSVIFHYNAYEIGPYVLGSTIFSLPRTILVQ